MNCKHTTIAPRVLTVVYTTVGPCKGCGDVVPIGQTPWGVLCQWCAED